MEILAPDFGLLFWIIISVILILPLIALIDLLRSQFINNDKLVWTIVVVFVPLFGSLLYFTIGRKQKM